MEERDRKLAEAHARLSELADGLVQRYGPLYAAGLFLGVALGVLEVNFGGAPAVLQVLDKMRADYARRPELTN